MAEVEKTLEKLGFSPNEIKVYLTLNDHGSMKAGRIAKIAKIDRSSCYNALKLLLERGLASYVLIGEEKWFKTKLLCRKDRREKGDKKYSDHRYLPNVSESSAVTNIYGDKIAIIIWTDEPEGIIIENSAAAKAYKSYFDVMWKNARKK